MDSYDAILIPGGGITDDLKPAPWVKARLDHAFKIKNSKYIITLSAGTPHRPQRLDHNGFPVYESVAGAQYLLEKGLSPDRIMSETCSYDTIGNAFFTRLIFTDPLLLTNLLVVTSAFHLPRTQVIFDWIFSLPPLVTGHPYRLFFQATPDTGIKPDDLTARKNGENKRLQAFYHLPAAIKSLPELHRWLYTQHEVYAVHLTSRPIQGKEQNTY